MLVAMALAFACGAAADLQLMQMSVHSSVNAGSAELAEFAAAPASYLDVVWPCSDPGIGSSTFTLLQELSATGAPIYHNDDGSYLYWDASCDGSTNGASRWIIDADAPSTAAASDLDSDGVCSYFGHYNSPDSQFPWGDSTWLGYCNGATLNMTVTITVADSTAEPTPAPTLEPGVPCTCSTACGIFPYIDIDGDGCLGVPELDQIEQLAGRFSELDVDGDGCVNQTECAVVPDLPRFPPSPTPRCDCGDYVAPGTSVCVQCPNGETRRRRATECNECAAGKTHVDGCDRCIGDMYLTGDAEVSDTRVCVNTDTEAGGTVLTRGDTITIAKCCCEGPSDHAKFVIEDATSSPATCYDLPEPLTMDFDPFDPVTKTCTSTDGSGYSASYPCGCGCEICEFGTKCDEAGNGGTGICMGPSTSPLPTPAPSVSAKGDPHLVNLAGEHFDVNHGGEFLLLRIPQDKSKPPMVKLSATIAPEHGKPCVTYITELELSGSWFGGKAVQVRCYLKSRASNETDKFLGLRVLDRTHGAPADADEAPWEKLEQWTDNKYVVSDPQKKDGFGVTLSTSKWNSHRAAKENAPNVAGQVVIAIHNGWLSSEPTRFIIRQDQPQQEHLNMAVRKLSSLGHTDIGGLLGFDEHPEALEDVTEECQRYRSGLDHERGPKFKPAWKVRWQKIREQRDQAHAGGDGTKDNEAAASLEARGGGAKAKDDDEDVDMTCVCPDDDPSEDPYTGLAGDVEASWD